MQILVPPEFEPLWRQDDEHPVVKYPAEVLRQKAGTVERVNKKTRDLIERMLKVLKKSNGIGLAAPQIGVLERVILVGSESKKLTALINPVVVSSEGSALGEEGCLSLPGLYGDVERPSIVTVEAVDEEGKPVRLRMEGLAARVVQHEIDHLDGVLFIDKVDPASLHWSWPAGVSAE